MSGIRGDWSKQAREAAPMHCARCGHPRASSSRPCFVTTPLRAAIGLQKALPRGEGRSCRRRSDKRSRLRQDDSAECCCSHHPCSNDALRSHTGRVLLLCHAIDGAIWSRGKTYLSAPATHLSAVYGWAAFFGPQGKPHQNGRRERRPLVLERNNTQPQDHSDVARRCRREPDCKPTRQTHLT